MKLSTCVTNNFIVGVSTLLFTTSVSAQAVRQIYSSAAQGFNRNIPQIYLREGSGLNLNFIPTGEIIKKVWLDDPSKLTLDFDGALCSTQTSNSPNSTQSCPSNAGASVIHLRRINPLYFPGLPATSKTLLTVVTESEYGRRVYQFQVVMGSGYPEYSTIQIIPDTRNTTYDWEAVERGLNVAQTRRYLSANSPIRARVDAFLTQVRNGILPEIAAQTTGVNLAVIEKLQQLGLRSMSNLQQQVQAEPAPSNNPVITPSFPVPTLIQLKL